MKTRKAQHRMKAAYFLRKLFLVLGSLLAFASARGDSPYIVKVQHYSLGEGLPNRGVTAIEQDQQGFVWIGTYSNAYRFDGHTFKALPLKVPSPFSPSVPSIALIHSDSDGNNWFFNFTEKRKRVSLLLADHETHSFFEDLFGQPLPFDPNVFLSTQLHLTAGKRPREPMLIYDSDGSVWQHKGQNHFKRLYQHPVPLAPRNLLVTATGTIMLNYPSTENTLENELIELWPSGTIRRRQRIPATLHPIWVDPQGTIYLTYFTRSSTKEALIYRPKLTAHRVDALLYQLSPNGTLTNVPILLPKNPFPEPTHYNFIENPLVYDEKHGLFWFLGNNVLFAWHPKHGIVFDLAASGFPIASLIDFRNLFVDRTGAVWVGSENGFLLLTLEPNHFQRHFYVPYEETTLPTVSSRGIVKTSDWLWLSTNGGNGLILNLKTGRSQKVLPKEQSVALLGHDGRIWTVSDSLIQIDPNTLAIKKFALHEARQYCWAIWQDGGHNFWLGHAKGLSYFNIKQKQDYPFTKYNQYQELATNRIHGIFPDPTVGGLWLATTSGLYLLDTLRGITARYSSRDPAPHHLPFDYITFIHQDRQQPGIYWLSTMGGGLIRWERKTGRWQQFTQEQGLSNNDLYSVYEDARGRLWLPSNFGLMRFDKQTHQIRVFLPKDGIAHEEFNMTSHFQSADGQLFLGGLNGITAFYPDKQLDEKPTIVPLLVTQYEQLNANTGQRTDHLPAFQRSQQIVIPPENRSFSLSFALLDYRYGRQFRLSYRIINWQNYWTSQIRPDISINGLPPGTYQLQVRAQNPNGQWASKTLTIPITVLKPFYLQTWFLTLSILSLIGATIGFFQWRTHRLSQETKRLEEEVARRTAQIANDKAVIEKQAADLRASATLKSRFFANVSHEFRTPLTLLLGPLTYLSKHLSDPTMSRLVTSMDRNARQLLTMVSDLLDLSKLDENRIQLTNQPADLAKLIHQTIAMFLSQAEYIGIQLTTEGVEKPVWLLLDVTKVETVLKNLLANALRFTPSGGRVTVRLTESTDWVRVAVTDTGSGIHPDDLPHIFERYYQSQQPDAPVQGGTGIGLALSHEYCTLWGGELTVDSQLGKGSTFAFTYPYHPAIPQESALPSQRPNQEPISTPSEPSPSNLASHILLVEDNPDMAEYLTTVLAPHYFLHVTRNGREAWQWLNARAATDLPQVIISDLMMPDMDGLSLVNEIRQQPHVRDIPVLMLTARTSLDVKLQALRLGVADYMTKPFDQDELITRIGNLIERAQERAAWQKNTPDEPVLPSPPSEDEEWLLQIEQLALKNLTNRYFQVNSIAEAVNSSERQLYRRLKKQTGLSPNQFIQEIRLQTAREWLENQHYATVKEVCYAVGFQDVVYFSRLFLQRFGRYPVTFLRTTEHTDNQPDEDHRSLENERSTSQQSL